MDVVSQIEHVEVRAWSGGTAQFQMFGLPGENYSMVAAEASAEQELRVFSFKSAWFE